MNKLVLRFILLTFACLIAAMATVSAKGTLEEQRNEIREMSKATLEKVYEKYPSAQRVISECYGYATLSNSDVKLLFISTGRGRGVAVNNVTGEEVFMKMKEVGVGLGAGAKEFDLVFVFANEYAWSNFISGKTKLGGKADATATDGVSGGAIEGADVVSRGIWVYQMTTKGLSLEATLNGIKYYQDKKLNKK